MKKRKILVSGLVMAVVGSGLGFVLAALFDPPYTSRHYRNIRRVYVIVGGAGGFLYGASISTVKQLKDQQDQRDRDIIAARPPANHDSSS